MRITMLILTFPLCWEKCAFSVQCSGFAFLQIFFTQCMKCSVLMPQPAILGTVLLNVLITELDARLECILSLQMILN